MSKKVKCMTCGSMVENEYNWHCDACKDREDKKRRCYHMPESQTYETRCLKCKLPMVASDWRIK